MTIRTAKNRLFRPDARTGAEKAWEMRLGFFGLSGGWWIMFCLDGVEFRLFSFCCRYRKYMSFLSVRIFIMQSCSGKKNTRSGDLYGRKRKLFPRRRKRYGRKRGVFTRTSRRFTPNTGTFYAECPGTLSLPEGLLEGCPFTSVRKRLPEERKFRIGRSAKQAFLIILQAVRRISFQYVNAYFRRLRFMLHTV